MPMPLFSAKSRVDRASVQVLMTLKLSLLTGRLVHLEGGQGNGHLKLGTDALYLGS